MSTGKVNQDDIQTIVAATIKEVHEAQAIRFEKPTTLRGWMMTIGLVGGLIGFLFTAAVFLNRVADHHNSFFVTSG